MLRVLFVASAALFLLMPLSAQSDVVGRWRMTVHFPNNPVAGTLDLQQQDESIGGRFVASFAGGEVPIEGDYADGQLTFSGATTGGPHPGLQLDFTGRLQDDGTMAGTLSWQVGDFRWTAERMTE